jgi:hypothetical protein
MNITLLIFNASTRYFRPSNLILFRERFNVVSVFMKKKKNPVFLNIKLYNNKNEYY